MFEPDWTASVTAWGFTLTGADDESVLRWMDTGAADFG
jgi:hypothetical protein